MNQLTIKQALEQGYTLCGRSDYQEYQILMSFEDFSKDDFDDAKECGYKFILANKDEIYHTTNAKELMDFAIDDFDNDENFALDDTGEMQSIIKKETEFFEEMATRLNAIYRKHGIYKMTDIELILN